MNEKWHWHSRTYVHVGHRPAKGHPLRNHHYLHKKGFLASLRQRREQATTNNKTMKTYQRKDCEKNHRQKKPAKLHAAALSSSPVGKRKENKNFSAMDASNLLIILLLLVSLGDAQLPVTSWSGGHAGIGLNSTEFDIYSVGRFVWRAHPLAARLDLSVLFKSGWRCGNTLLADWRQQVQHQQRHCHVLR